MTNMKDPEWLQRAMELDLESMCIDEIPQQYRSIHTCGSRDDYMTIERQLLSQELMEVQEFPPVYHAAFWHMRVYDDELDATSHLVASVYAIFWLLETIRQRDQYSLNLQIISTFAPPCTKPRSQNLRTISILGSIINAISRDHLEVSRWLWNFYTPQLKHDKLMGVKVSQPKPDRVLGCTCQ
jgi:hypothetical protein